MIREWISKWSLVTSYSSATPQETILHCLEGAHWVHTHRFFCQQLSAHLLEIETKYCKTFASFSRAHVPAMIEHLFSMTPGEWGRGNDLNTFVIGTLVYMLHWFKDDNIDHLFLIYFWRSVCDWVCDLLLTTAISPWQIPSSGQPLHKATGCFSP